MWRVWEIRAMLVLPTSQIVAAHRLGALHIRVIGAHADYDKVDDVSAIWID